MPPSPCPSPAQPLISCGLPGSEPTLQLGMRQKYLRVALNHGVFLEEPGSEGLAFFFCLWNVVYLEQKEWGGLHAPCPPKTPAYGMHRCWLSLHAGDNGTWAQGGSDVRATLGRPRGTRAPALL